MANRVAFALGLLLLAVAIVIASSSDFADAKMIEQAACERALLDEGPAPEGVDCSVYATGEFVG